MKSVRCFYVKSRCKPQKRLLPVKGGTGMSVECQSEGQTGTLPARRTSLPTRSVEIDRAYLLWLLAILSADAGSHKTFLTFLSVPCLS